MKSANVLDFPGLCWKATSPLKRSQFLPQLVLLSVAFGWFLEESLPFPGHRVPLNEGKKEILPRFKKSYVLCVSAAHEASPQPSRC